VGLTLKSDLEYRYTFQPETQEVLHSRLALFGVAPSEAVRLACRIAVQLKKSRPANDHTGEKR